MPDEKAKKAKERREKLNTKPEPVIRIKKKKPNPNKSVENAIGRRKKST